MYKVYLKTQNESIKPFRVITKFQHEAEKIFKELCERIDLKGTPSAAILSFNNVQIKYHRFDSNHWVGNQYAAVDDEKRKNQQITIRLTKNEKKQLETGAAKVGKKLTVFIRDKLLKLE